MGSAVLSGHSAIALSLLLQAWHEQASWDSSAQTEELSSSTPELYAVVRRYATAEAQNGWNSSDADIDFLNDLIAQRDPIGSALAYGWLEARGEDIPEEIILHPGDTPKRNIASRRSVDWPSTVQLEVFPNPSNGQAFVAFETPMDAAHAELRVVDLSGRELYSARTDSGPGLQTLVTDTWSNGVYLVELRVDGAAFATSKLVVQR